MASGTPDCVVVGHVCQDLLPDGSLTLGGSASYAATTAMRMGYRVGVVTSAGPDLDLRSALPGVEVVCREVATTTLFENIYLNGGRRQILHQRAAVLTCDQIPASWRGASMAFLGSIDQEIELGVFLCFAEETLVCVTPQGFFRRWDDQGLVCFADWRPPETVLQRINVLVLSELDLPHPEKLVGDWGRFIETIVITRAERGATVYRADGSRHYPVRPTQQADPTGAGDVFAAAFLIRLAETSDPCQAAQFANVVASLSVAGPGMRGIPARVQVEQYLRQAGAKVPVPS